MAVAPRTTATRRPGRRPTGGCSPGRTRPGSRRRRRRRPGPRAGRRRAAGLGAPAGERRQRRDRAGRAGRQPGGGGGGAGAEHDGQRQQHDREGQPADVAVEEVVEERMDGGGADDRQRQPHQRREQPGDRALQEDRAAQVGGRAAGGGHHAQQAQLPPGTDGERGRRHDRHHQEGHAREDVEVADPGAAAREPLPGGVRDPLDAGRFERLGVDGPAPWPPRRGRARQRHVRRCPTAMCSAGGEAVTTMYPSLSADGADRARDRHLPAPAAGRPRRPRGRRRRRARRRSRRPRRGARGPGRG